MGGAQQRTGQRSTSAVDGPAAGWLRPDRLADHGPATLGPGVARLHHRLRADLVDHLLAAVPDGWEVCAGCCWQPAVTEAALRPDVAVHPTLAEGEQLREPPALCVDIADGPADPRLARAYARLGVDHHWHVDSRRGTLQVSVRLDDAYRHCETFSAETLVLGPASRAPAWIDFGVGIAHVDRLMPQFFSRAAV